jgi:hypothetical protein
MLALTEKSAKGKSKNQGKMSDMRKKDMKGDTPIAVFVSDLHLRHIAPIARKEKDKDWYEVMGRYCNQLREIAGNLPIFCAGDIFHKWNSPPELINWCIQHLPRMYAVPGNHDLPLHNYKDMNKAAYWTLVKAKVIQHLDPERIHDVGENLRVWGFPYGHPLSPCPEEVTKSKRLKIAIVHKYIWTGGCSEIPDAPSESLASNLNNLLKGYDAAAFGDNHIGFMLPPDRGTLLNCGTFIRQKTSEINLNPTVGILYCNGNISPKRLDISTDRWEEEVVSTVKNSRTIDLEGFLDLLGDTEECSLDFADALRRYTMKQKTPVPIQRIITRCLEGAK